MLTWPSSAGTVAYWSFPTLHGCPWRRERQRKLRDLALRLRAEGKVYKKGKQRKHKPRRRVQVSCMWCGAAQLQAWQCWADPCGCYAAACMLRHQAGMGIAG